jgi:hypothetical protein
MGRPPPRAARPRPIRQPDLVRRFASGDLEASPCVPCNQFMAYVVQPTRCPFRDEERARSRVSAEAAGPGRQGQPNTSGLLWRQQLPVPSSTAGASRVVLVM